MHIATADYTAMCQVIYTGLLHLHRRLNQARRDLRMLGETGSTKSGGNVMFQDWLMHAQILHVHVNPLVNRLERKKRTVSRASRSLPRWSKMVYIYM